MQCRHFNKGLKSGEEKVNPNSYRYRACLYIDEGCSTCHNVFMRGKSLDTDNPLDLVDTKGFTFAYLVSRLRKRAGLWSLQDLLCLGRARVLCIKANTGAGQRFTRKQARL